MVLTKKQGICYVCLDLDGWMYLCMKVSEIILIKSVVITQSTSEPGVIM